MADIVNKLKLTIDEALWKNSTTKAIDEFAKQIKTVGEKVRAQGTREQVFKEQAKATTDPLARRVAADESKQAKKKADEEFKVHKQMTERITEATKLANQKRFGEAKRLLKDFYKDQEKEATRGIPLSGGLLFGRHGTRIAEKMARDGATAGDQRSGMLRGALGSVGGNALQTGAHTLGGSMGSRILNNFQQGGVVGGAGNSIVDSIQYAISNALSVGVQRSQQARSNAGSFTNLGGRGGYYSAVGAGRAGGLFQEEASAFAGQAGRSGMSPFAMKGLGLMQTRFGMGSESIGMLGAAAKFGQGGEFGNGKTKEEREGAFQSRMLIKAVAQGTASGLRMGRMPEFFQAVTSILHNVQPGSKANLQHTMDFMQGLGHAGFKGAEGQHVATSLDALAKGGNNPLSQALSLTSLGGYGKSGVSYVSALQSQQRGLFEGTSDSDTSQGRFSKLYDSYKQYMPDRDTMKYQLGQGSGLGLDAVEKLMQKMEGGGLLTGADMKQVKPVDKLEQQIKLLGDIRDPLTAMKKKLEDIFAKLFNDKEFITSLKQIAEALPELAKAMTILAGGAAKTFNKVNRAVGGMAEVAGVGMTEGPSAAVRETIRQLEPTKEEMDKRRAEQTPEQKAMNELRARAILAKMDPNNPALQHGPSQATQNVVIHLKTDQGTSAVVVEGNPTHKGHVQVRKK